MEKIKELFEIGKVYTRDDIHLVRIKHSLRDYCFGVNAIGGWWHIKTGDYVFKSPALGEDFVCYKTPTEELESEINKTKVNIQVTSDRKSSTYYQRSTPGGGVEKFNPIT